MYSYSVYDYKLFHIRSFFWRFCTVINYLLGIILNYTLQKFKKPIHYGF